MRRLPAVFSFVLVAIAFAVAGDTTLAQDGSAPAELPLLTKSRGNYNQQLTQIWDETGKKIAVLNRDYLEKLAGLDRTLQQQGNLDGLLQVRQEQERFKTSQNVTEADVTTLPAALPALQRDYIKLRRELEADRNQRARQLAQKYLTYLGKLKRELTQQNNVDAALQIHEEENRLKTSLGLDTADTASPPANPPATDAHELVVDTGILHPMYKPPAGYVWVIITDKGFPAKEITLVVQDKSSNKITEYLTDSTGRISFQSDPGQTYRIMLVSEGWGMQEVSEAKPGNAYWFKLARASGDTAACVRVKDNYFVLPEIGKINFSGSWFSSNGETGPFLKAADGDVRFEQGNNRQDFVHAHPDITYTATRDKVSYEFRLIKLAPTGNQYLVVYKRK